MAQHSWWSPFLVEGTHYIGTHTEFTNIVERVAWANAHDDQARAIGRAAAEFADAQLSTRCAAKALRLQLEELARLAARLHLQQGPGWQCPRDCVFDGAFA